MSSSSRRSAAASSPHASTSTQGNQGASISSLVAALSLQRDDSSGSDQTHYTAPLRLGTHRSAQRVDAGSSASSPTREAAWSDGASEVDPQQAREWQRERRRLMRCSSPLSPNVSSMSAQELEVAALRRQVEQLQYLLDKRAREEGGQSDPRSSARGTEDAAGAGSRGRSRTRHHHHHQHQHHSRSSSGQQQLTTRPLFHSPTTSDRDFGRASQQRGSGSTGREGSSTWTTTTSSSSAGAGPSRHGHRKASSTAGKSTTSSGRRVVFVDTLKKSQAEEDDKGKQRSVVYMRGPGGSSPVPVATQKLASSSSSLPSLDPITSAGHGTHSGGLHSKTHHHHHPHHARKAATTGRHLVSFAVGRRRSTSSTEKERKSSGGSTSRPGSVASGGNGGGRRNNVVVFERGQEQEEEAPRVKVVQRMRVGPGRGVLNVGRKER